MIAETMYSDGSTRTAYLPGSEGFNNIVNKINEIFGQQDTSCWVSATTEQTNNIVEDEVVSVMLKHGLPYLDHIKTVALGRKFFITKKEIYDKVYLLIPSPYTCRFNLPENSNVISEGYLINIFGQPGDEDLSRYRCIYFSCSDHSAVEQWYGSTLPKGLYSTYYAATFDNITKERLRVKTYCYDEKSIYSDWGDKIALHRNTVIPT